MNKTRIFEIPGTEKQRIKFEITGSSVNVIYQEHAMRTTNDSWKDIKEIGRINYKAAFWYNTKEMENE